MPRLIATAANGKTTSVEISWRTYIGVRIAALKWKVSERIWDFKCWLAGERMHYLCRLWDLRGLKTCEEHGFYHQSWISGVCNKCDWFNKIYEAAQKREGINSTPHPYSVTEFQRWCVKQVYPDTYLFGAVVFNRDTNLIERFDGEKWERVIIGSYLDVKKQN